MFKENSDIHRFQWRDLGDIALGRPNLGPSTSVAVYRLMQYTLRDVLIARYDPETAGDILREAGKLAGSQFCSNMLNTGLDFSGFIAEVQEKLRDLKVGILRMEKTDLQQFQFVLTVSEDLDCSGIPVTDETICDYDEGFIAGILQTYTGQEFVVKEIDCWASGEKTCRFAASPKQG
jgi:uncharacterized protein